MTQRPIQPRRLLALLGAVALLGLLLAGSAQAAEAPWGELERFGEKGTGAGQLEAPEYAFGIDQSDGGLWVVDTVAEGKNFRVQKFMKEGGKYKVVASTTFKPKDPGGEEEDEVEGVAFDPSLKRAYLLVSEERPPLKKGIRIDEVPAAAELYAFSTEPSAGKIVGASGTKEEGLLAGAEVLEPLVNEFGKSVLEPGGIAVDPTNHDVLIAGFIDRGKNKPATEGTGVVEQVTSEGKLGSRWVDESDFFEECECLNSPVVTSTGHIYLLGELDELDEIPSSLKGAPKRLFAFDCETCTFNEHLTEFPGQNPYNGSQMSIGSEGNIYVRSRVRLASEEEFFHGGVMVLSPTFEELGWTGGNTQASETKACSINEALFAPVVAAGTTEHTVYVLQRFKNEPRIVELGPGGGGCPKASATVPSAKAGGFEVEPVPIADKVTLSSTLTQANALSVEWEFGDGSPTQTVSTRQQQTSSVEHTFLKEGKLTVKERIHTDDLASPVIEKERTLNVVGKPSIRSEEAVIEGTSAALKGEVNPNSSEVKECHFEYGKASEAFPTKERIACPGKPGAGEKFVPVSVKVVGLEKQGEYHFRITAKNADGEATGAGKTFKVENPPVATTEAASAVGTTLATLNGKVNPKGSAVECHFEYGTTASYGSTVACSSAPGEGEVPVAESAAISGLKSGTGYHFRIVAASAGTTVYGTDQTFATKVEVGPPPPPPPPPPPGGSNPGGGVLPHTETKASPIVTIASSSAPVTPAGAFSLKVSCPSGETTCSGSVTIKTLTAVLARAHAAKKKAILTLASGSFSVAGGQSKTLTLHLSAKARKLLSHTHVLKGRVTILAHDPAGGTHTTIAVLTLRLAKGKHH